MIKSMSCNSWCCLHGSWKKLGNYCRTRRDVWENKIIELFDSMWFVDMSRIIISTELFKSNWFANNMLTNLDSDNFNVYWFFNNIFNSLLFVDDFESGCW